MVWNRSTSVRYEWGEDHRGGRSIGSPCVGGFPGLFPRWEDWAIFLRAFRRGATIEHVPEAEYLQHWRADSMVRTVADVCDPKQLHADIREWA